MPKFVNGQPLKMRNLSSVITYILVLFLMLSCGEKKKEYVIGVSQCSEDVWRKKMNDELKTATYFYDNVKLVFASANDNGAEQVKQIDNFVKHRVNLIIVAPNQTQAITPAIENAMNHGIPVVAVDRKTANNKYTAFIGADNYHIGETMGQYIGTQLNGHGKVVEICGLEGSSPMIERHRGFTDAMKRFPGISITATLPSNWREDSGEAAMDSLIRSGQTDFDLVFGHNDRLASGAMKALKAHGIKRNVKLCGIDALPIPGGGMQLVKDHILLASCIYPTQGDKVLELAMNILEGRPYRRDNSLSTALVTQSNAAALMMLSDETASEQEKLEHLHGKIDRYLAQYTHQQVYLVLTIIICLLIIAIAVVVYRSFVVRSKIKEEAANTKINFFTRVGHALRTPLTVISGPVERLLENPDLTSQQRDALTMVNKNTKVMLKLVDEILDFRNQNENCDLSGKVWENIEKWNRTIEKDEGKNRRTSNKITSPQDNAERPTILVVEDSEDVRNYVASLLGENYDVETANDGREGCRQARRLVPDLIVSDVMMPVMDGLEMCKQLKGDVATSHIPVILLTARAMDAQRAEGYESGADAYITKPFNGKVLLSRINNLLEERQRLKDIFGGASAAAEVRTDSNPKANGDIDNSFAERFRAIIHENMGNSELSVEYIGAKLGLSRVQMYRKIKALTGKSPVELIKEARLRRAEQLISTTERTISEIAYEVGFSSPAYFTKCYKEYFGHTPKR